MLNKNHIVPNIIIYNYKETYYFLNKKNVFEKY